jgi:hypothetical protein
VLSLFGVGFSCRADIFFPTQNGTGGNATNIVTPVPNSGILHIDYDFYTIPDHFDVYYDGADLFSSGQLSSTGHIDIPYGPGVSDSLIIIMNKDTWDLYTDWQYTPSISPVPEPGTIPVLAVGLFALGFAARMRLPAQPGNMGLGRHRRCPSDQATENAEPDFGKKMVAGGGIEPPT